MNRSTLERAVARATGESRRTIRRFGFSLVPDEPPTTAATHLGLDCPGCGAGIALLNTEFELPEYAECARCDAAYPYKPDELYLQERSDAAIGACA